MRRDELVKYLDDLLQIKAIEDSSNNGLQVEGAAQVQRLAFAVDASLAAFEGARATGAQMTACSGANRSWLPARTAAGWGC